MGGGQWGFEVRRVAREGVSFQPDRWGHGGRRGEEAQGELRSTGTLDKVFSRKRPGSCAAGCLLGRAGRGSGPLCA